MRKLLYSPRQTLGVPFALTPIGLFYVFYVTPSQRNARENHGENRTLVDEVCGQAQVRPIDKLDEACTNADD